MQSSSISTAKPLEVLEVLASWRQALEPHSKASVRHGRAHVDEFLWVVDGEATVTEDDGPQAPHPAP